MIFSISSSPKDRGPIIQTRVLNPQECGINLVGAAFGKLCYTPIGAWNSTTKGIAQVIFIQSEVVRGRVPNAAVEADFDIYLTDGRVIEVHTCNRAVIEAALKYTRTPDPRDKYRRARGVI